MGTGRIVVGMGLALAVGLAGGWWFARPVGTTEVNVSAPSRASVRTSKPDAAHDDLERLSRRNRMLEAENKRLRAALEAKPTAVEEPKAETVEARPDESRRRFGPPSPEELAKLAETDPARYVQMTNRMARFDRMRQNHQARVAESLDLLASIDTSDMTARQRQVHERFQELMAQREELGAQAMPGGAEMTEEERHKAFRQMHEIGQELNRLAEQERTTLLSQTARQLGLKSHDAKDLVEAVKCIYESTQTGPRGFGPPPGRHP